MTRLLSIGIGLAAVLFLTTARPAVGAERYVATTGSNGGGNTGMDINLPLATIAQAITLSAPGDTIWVRGGTYNFSSTLTISTSKNGTAASPFKLINYQDEQPILDFRGQAFGSAGITLQANYWQIKGLTVQYAGDNGLYVRGSNNMIEQVVARQNQDSGFQIRGTSLSSLASNNLLLNCDSYGNYDTGSPPGEDADGFAVKFREVGPGNVISGARAWNNSDDGFDFWQAANGVTVVNSWSFHNGLANTFNNPASFSGDGNGIKLGKDSGTHILKNMLVWGNPAHGVDINGNATESGGVTTPAVIPHGVQILNVTSVGNGSRNFNFDEDPTDASPPTAHILRNNISFNGSVSIDSGNTTDHNTFAGPGGSPAGLGATASDFVSTAVPITTNGSFRPALAGADRDGTTMPAYATGAAVAARLADGSLPPLDFMRLVAGSDLINAGVDVGLPFNGSAPDLGAFEYAPPIVYDAADFTRDGFVRGDDLDRLTQNFGTGALNTQGDADLDGDVDGDDLLVWQRHLNQPASVASSAAVPEPAAFTLLALAALARGCFRSTFLSCPRSGRHSS